MGKTSFWNDAAKYGAMVGLLLAVSTVVENSIVLSGRLWLYMLLMVEWVVAVVLHYYLLHRFTRRRAMQRDETEGFYYRELGLYAEDPDPEVGEVLYCYGNCGDLAEWIPPSGGATIVEKTIDIVTAIGTATNVTAYIPADAYATKEDYENYKAIALAAQATANQAILLAQQAVGIAEQAAAAVVDLSNVVQQNTSKITTLWDAVFGDITTNPFQITFADLDGITLTSGVWNATLQRLEC